MLMMVGHEGYRATLVFPVSELISEGVKIAPKDQKKFLHVISASFSLLLMDVLLFVLLEQYCKVINGLL